MLTIACGEVMKTRGHLPTTFARRGGPTGSAFVICTCIASERIRERTSQQEHHHEYYPAIPEPSSENTGLPRATASAKYRRTTTMSVTTEQRRRATHLRSGDISGTSMHPSTSTSRRNAESSRRDQSARYAARTMHGNQRTPMAHRDSGISDPAP